jgi:DNA-binding response OmpR family regulator
MMKKRVLVIGGEPQVNEWLARALRADFEILTARSGVEAINKAVLYRPTCILLDALMPGIGDFKLSKVFKIIDQTRVIPILLVCENPDPEFRKMLQEMGVADCIEKSFSPEQVSRVIDRVLKMPLGERRKTPRVRTKIQAIIRIRRDEDQEAEIVSELEEVSRLGALVSLPLRVGVRQRVEIRRMDPTLKGEEHLSTSACVIWNDGEENDGLYWHGLQFLNPSTQWTIRQYIQ